MKNSPLQMFAVKTLFLSIFGISLLPFLCVIVQYIDSVTGFSLGNGYHSNPSDYLLESPLVYIEIVLLVNIILSIVYLIYNFKKN